jgi:hypothetical protein
MKLKKDEKIDSLNLVSEELEFIKREDSEFWVDIRGLMKYGIPAYDGKGHFIELRIKVRPMQMDMISAIRERTPDGWFKSQAALCRSILAVGCKVYLKALGDEKSKWHGVLMGLNQLAKKQRLDEFRNDVESLITDITKGSMPPHEKVKIIDTITELRDKMFEMEDHVDKGKDGIGDKWKRGKMDEWISG